ncbi:hypothetical protein [Rhodovulum sp.]|uniref:hypothetical protein n=1 Tax=Rhodovulum sp. TaxID=34009 RepID=UPI0017956753|nr:hypothetical protein [Rhodovulum sp.]HDR29001.1 hypothetical protein [Rhodovulum sp.]
MSTRRLLSRGARLAGFAILAAALWFLGRELVRHWPSLAAWRPDPASLAVIGLLALAYGGLLFLLAEAWHRIVAGFGAEPRRRTYLSFTATQIARYLPGNVAHLLGRALWLRGGPLGDGALARATAIEVAVTPAGAVLVLALALPLLPLERLQLPGWASGLVPPDGALALGAFAVIGLGAALAARRIRGIAGPLLLAMSFMVGLGAVFAGVAVLLGFADPLLAGFVAVIAWLVGYLTPGAPGGLGMREAVLVAVLGANGGGEGALLAALVFRIVTILGDLACFLVGWQVLWTRRASTV